MHVLKVDQKITSRHFPIVSACEGYSLSLVPSFSVKKKQPKGNDNRLIIGPYCIYSTLAINNWKVRKNRLH